MQRTTVLDGNDRRESIAASIDDALNVVAGGRRIKALARGT